MESRTQRPSRPIRLRAWICIAALIVTGHGVGASEGAGNEPQPAVEAVTAFPVGERLSFAISWLGVHCGEMEITSFVESGPEGESIYRIVVLARTTKFFDGVYRVRSRLDSYFDPRRVTSIRYDENSVEKKKRKSEVWLVDLETMELVRTKNGEETRFPVEVERAYDPLAFIYRLRTMKTEVGTENVLGLMTSKGAVETVARVREHKTIKTKMGKCDAAAVVPEPRDKMMFSKSGSMVVWIDRQNPHRPCKIEFDLSFGKLSATLSSADDGAEGGVPTEWETWGDSGGDSR
jgi:hypothetical protein